MVRLVVFPFAEVTFVYPASSIFARMRAARPLRVVPFNTEITVRAPGGPLGVADGEGDTDSDGVTDGSPSVVGVAVVPTPGVEPFADGVPVVSRAPSVTATITTIKPSATAPMTLARERET